MYKCVTIYMGQLNQGLEDKYILFFSFSSNDPGSFLPKPSGLSTLVLQRKM
jgi:hypothetical protein